MGNKQNNKWFSLSMANYLFYLCTDPLHGSPEPRNHGQPLFVSESNAVCS